VHGAASGEPACSIVIGTIGRPDLLDRCLTALAESTTTPYEAVVVDNTRGDSGTELIAGRHHARYLKVPWTGLSGARNAGARASRAPIIAFLDDDAAPERDWIPALLAPFADEQVMAVTGRVRPFEAEAAARRRMGIPVEPDLGSEPRVVSLETPNWFEICNFGGLGIGANMAFRGRIFMGWRGFSERLGPGTPLQGADEHNAFFELVRRGYKVVYQPKASVLHRYPHTLPAIRRNQFRYLAGAAAYATLLVVEEPAYSQQTIRYMFEAVRGERREWRLGGTPPHSGVLPRGMRLFAFACGPFLYAVSFLWLAAERVRALLAPGGR
jgi:cellulose synthase/poly-beta-1,6-N-acetylglucosamine synthase-like glycosyltransferase